MRSRLHALSLRQMRFIVALADEGSFSRAAARFRVSQPALSAGIRQVESLLDMRLFERTTHRVSITASGEALLPHVRRLLTTADHVFIDMEDAVHRRHVVRLGVIPSMMPVLARQVSTAPMIDLGVVDLHLSDGNSDTLVEQLLHGALDLAVCAGMVDHRLLRIEPLLDDELLLVVAPDHRFARAASVPWRDLHDEELVYLTSGSIGDITSAAMRQNNLSASRRYRVDQVSSLFGLAGAGLAVGIMPRLYAIGYATDEVLLVPLEQPWVARKIIITARHALGIEHPVADRLAHWLNERLRVELSRAPAMAAGAAED